MRQSRILCMVASLLLTSGCHRYLVETPNLLRHQDAQRYFANCPADCETADAAVLYATDRAVEIETTNTKEYKSKGYGFNRATSLSFGVAGVSLNPNPTWKELINESTLANRGRDFELKLASVREEGTFDLRALPSKSPLPNLIVPAKTERMAAMHQGLFERLLRDRLSKAADKDVYIFVHGFNNTFEDSVFRAAEVWHFMGRNGVPIAYSWPAGRGGIRGYAYDRESGEFTVGHLRRFIHSVADCPDVERVHLVAHSRGCDVTISALRELHLGFAAQGKSTQQELKLENLVLAAPDVDEEVFLQRFVGEGLLKAARRTTIYASEHDKAIELTDVIFASRRRLGMLGVKDFNTKMKHGLARMPNVQFIECKLSGLWIGHSYVFTHPAALSDLILVLRDRRPPGAEHGRPLRQPAEGIWELTDDYLK